MRQEVRQAEKHASLLCIPRACLELSALCQALFRCWLSSPEGAYITAGETACREINVCRGRESGANGGPVCQVKEFWSYPAIGECAQGSGGHETS